MMRPRVFEDDDGRQRPDSAHAPRVEFGDEEITVFLNDRKPNLAAGTVKLVDPAVFVVGNDEFYLRADWRHWHRVTSDQPGLLQKIAASRMCVVTQTCDNGTRDFVAPVFRIPALPSELFPTSGAGDDSDGPRKFSPESNRQSIFADLSERFEKTSASDDGRCFTHISIGNYVADLVVSSEERCVLFAVVPREFDEMRAQSGESLELDTFPRSVEFVLRKLECCREYLKKIESDADIRLAILEEIDLAKSFAVYLGSQFRSMGVSIVPLEDFEKFIEDVFSE